MNRRDILKTIPSVSLAALGAVPVVADTESPLRALYHEWQAAKADHSAAEDESPEQDAAFERLCSFEDVAADFEPETFEDLAFKIIFADDNGDMSMNIHQQALARMAYRMVGIAPRHMIGGAA